MINPLPNTLVDDIITVTILLPVLGLMIGFFLGRIVRGAVEIWNSPDDHTSPRPHDERR